MNSAYNSISWHSECTKQCSMQKHVMSMEIKRSKGTLLQEVKIIRVEIRTSFFNMMNVGKTMFCFTKQFFLWKKKIYDEWWTWLKDQRLQVFAIQSFLIFKWFFRVRSTLRQGEFKEAYLYKNDTINNRYMIGTFF